MVVQPQPPQFKDHVHKFSFTLDAEPAQVWQWLNDPKTFTDTQVWPYKVEFYSPDPETVPDGFHEKVLTNHTGPFINFAGVITEIREDYRDLQYFYGSYAIRFGWIRPYRLEFWTEKTSDSTTTLTCAISCYVKPSIYGLWSTLQRIFWKRFERWATKSVKRLQKAENIAFS